MVLHTKKTTKRWTMQEVFPCPLQIALLLFYLCSNLPQLTVGKLDSDLEEGTCQQGEKAAFKAPAFSPELPR